MGKYFDPSLFRKIIANMLKVNCMVLVLFQLLFFFGNFDYTTKVKLLPHLTLLVIDLQAPLRIGGSTHRRKQIRAVSWR